jgi:hypothetical protein
MIDYTKVTVAAALASSLSQARASAAEPENVADRFRPRALV